MKRRVIAIGWIVIAALSGCGGDGLDRVEVSGNVTFAGEPLPRGEISLLPINGTKGPTVGTAIEDGEFVLSEAEGPIVGDYRVEIRASRATGRKIVDAFRSPPDNLVDEITQYVPTRYNSRSELTVSIVRPMDDLSLSLEDDQ